MKPSKLIVATLLFLIFAMTAHGEEQETVPNNSPNESEKAAYKEVNSFNPESLQSFLKAYPSGKNAQSAREALDLIKILNKIKTGKQKPHFVIPFEKIGGVDGWAGPGEMGFSGYFLSDQGSYASRGFFVSPFNGGKTPGVFTISFDSRGNRRIADTDGSIIAFNTDGLKFKYYGGVIFQTPGDKPAFFAVLKGKGFVHLKGKISVTVKGKEKVDLE